MVCDNCKERDAVVEGSVLMDRVRIGRGAHVRNAVLDKGVEVAPGARIGLNHDLDRATFTVSNNGVVVVAKNRRVPGDHR